MQFKINNSVYNIEGTSHILDLKEKTLSYLTKESMLSKIDYTKKALILVPKEVRIESDVKNVGFLKVDNPEAVFLSIHNKLYKYLEERKPQVKRRFPYVTFIPPVEIGRGCRISAGAVIGEDGFKIIKNLKGNAERLIHTGGVKIGNFVEIGAVTCIDKGTFGNTEIRDHVKIDNFVHVAHNCFIDKNSVIAPMVCLGGSSKIGKNVYIGIGASIRQGISIGDDAFIAMGSVVIDDVKEGESVAGNFAIDKEMWKKHHKQLLKNKSEVMKF